MPLWEININVKGQPTGGESTGESLKQGGKGKKERTTFQKILNWNSELKSSMNKSLNPTTMMAVSSGISLAQQVGRSYLSYFVSDIGRQTGDSNYQAQINRRMEVANDIMRVAGSALSGAAMGAMVGGPIGAGVGAVVGVASSAISIGVRRAERTRAFEHEMFKQNTSQIQGLARANFSATTGRLR